MQNWLDLTQLFRLLRGCVRTAKCNPTQGDDARPSPRHSRQFFCVFCAVVDAKITNPRQGQTARCEPFSQGLSGLVCTTHGSFRDPAHRCDAASRPVTPRVDCRGVA